MQTDAQYVRQKVFARDHGVCAACGVDTERLKEALLRLYDEDSKQAEDNATLLGFNLWVRTTRWGGLDCRSLWQADHILSVVEDGGLCGLPGYQTLCEPCHARKTAALAGKRAKERRAAKG